MDNTAFKRSELCGLLKGRVEGAGLVGIPRPPTEVTVPLNQADFPTVWLEVIDEVDSPNEINSGEEINTKA